MVKEKLLLHNGDIITMAKEFETVSWLYVVDGIIVDLGQYDGYQKYLDEADKVMDLKGHTLLPGFVDNHVFLMQTGINMLGVDLSKAESLQDVYDLINDKSKVTPKDHFIRASKFDELALKEKRFPTRYELDKITTNHPIWINRFEIHTSILNSQALSKVKIPHNLPGVIRENSVPTGVVTDHANARVRKYIYNSITDSERRLALSKACNKALSSGVTTAVAIGGGFVFGDSDSDYLMKHIHELPLDIIHFFNSTEIGELDKNRVTKCGSYFLDGTIGSRTAALYDSYCDAQDKYGSLYFSEKTLYDTLEDAHLSDMQTAVHAIGDRAIDITLDVFEEILNKYPKYNHRHRIEYFELPSPRAIKRVADMGLITMMIPAGIDYWCFEQGMYDYRLGRKRMDINNPLRHIKDAGITIASGSDSDITELNPFIGINATVNSSNTNKRLTLFEALKSFTLDGAYAVFEENIKGSIEKNKKADFILIDKNPFKIPTSELKEINVMKTFCNGQIMFERENKYE